MKNSTWMLIFLLFYGVGCNNRKAAESTKSETEKVSLLSANVPIFNGDSAYGFVKNQVKFGPRVPNTKAHKVCGDYVIGKLKAYGCEVTVQSFTKKAYDGTPLQLRNIIGSINPTASKRIILAAHWDTRPFADQEASDADKRKPIDGANDGASGVGVLLELARNLQMATTKPNVGIDLIFFDGEDYGQPDFLNLPEVANTWCLGSQYWCQERHKPGYQAYYGILLDMVGGKNAKFAMEGASMSYAPALTQRIWDIAAASGYGNVFINQRSESIVDDHYYINAIARVPMTDIIEYNTTDTNNTYFGAYWHTLSDNMEVIDPNTLKAVGQTLLHVVYAEP